MREERNITDDTRFVARHYRRGSFDTRAAWRKMAIIPGQGWRSLKIAATVAAVVAVGATAAFIYNGSRSDTPETIPAATETPAERFTAVKVIEFDDAPLPAVAARIEEVYGVRLTNLPDEAGRYRLTLRYEGTATDLTATINDILGTEMEVE